ncbi:15581_t:CDS:2 [Acaulospora colombiana]|uniref:15581_t:CDS:1 n=1 Tax=Acaulospora colombiana TaxID=27376 RepID=A0ACA9MJT8_9GLOM|nr:15581_t:CDS:2 [Acaulospora colombiana]
MGHLSFTGSKTAFLVSLLIFLTTFSASLVKPEEPAYPFGNVEVKMNMQTDEPILYGPPTINDIIPMEKDLTQFVDCLRTFGDIIDLISDPNSTITLFAPVNSAFRNLTRKPNYVGNSLEDPNKKMYQFVLGHIVPAMYQSLPVGQELQTMRKETTNFGDTFPHPNFLVECDSRALTDLLKHMKKYILRSKVSIVDVSPQYRIWNLWGNDINNLWWHHQVPNKTATKLPAGSFILKERLPSEEYVIRRIMHGVPEGIDDFEPGTSLPLQSNFDYMGGIDWRKGCYIGQELTFRTYYIGVTRKRIIPVQLFQNEKPPDTLRVDRKTIIESPSPSSGIHTSIENLSKQGRPVGNIGSARYNVTLALLSLDKVQENNLFVANGKGKVYKVKPFIPDWWPTVDDKDY